MQQNRSNSMKIEKIKKNTRKIKESLQREIENSSKKTEEKIKEKYEKNERNFTRPRSQPERREAKGSAKMRCSCKATGPDQTP